MKCFTCLAFAAVSLLFFAHPESAHALTSVPRDLDQLVARADTVFKGAVTSSTTRWIGQGEQRRIVTFVTFQVAETYKGTPAAEQTLRFLGGTVGDETMTVPDMPQFEVGQGAVLFVVGNNTQFCPLVGITQGRYHVLKEASGCERIFTDDFTPVSDTAEIGKVDAEGVPLLKRRAQQQGKDAPAADATADAMMADDFRTAILGKVAALPH